MRPALLGLLLVACGAPDRWQVSTGLGDGEFDTLKAGERDVDSQWVEVGVSGPLWRPQERRKPNMATEPCLEPSTPTALPIESGGLPVEELLLLLAGAGGWKASEMGYRKVKARKQA